MVANTVRPAILHDETGSDACIVLGTGSESYRTIFYTDHVRRTRQLCSEVLFDDCVPCCHRRSRRSGRLSVMALSFLRSEAFIYFLHITSIVLGCAKEGYATIHTDPVLTMIHSSIETFATLLLLAIRMANGWRSVPTVLKATRSVEYVDRLLVERTHVQQMRVYVAMHTMASILLIVVCIGTFLVCSFVIRVMTWTILSNNFCMITTTVLSGLLVARVGQTVLKVQEDQFKVIIYEAAMLIERPEVAESARTNSMFVEASLVTPLLKKPPYLGMDKSNESTLAMICLVIDYLLTKFHSVL